MTSARRLEGDPVAAAVLDPVAERVDRLVERGVTPTLGTVLASDDPADAGFMALKHDAAADLGIGTRDLRVDPDTGDEVVGAVRALSRDPAVHAIFVQVPLPPGTDEHAVRRAVAPAKDVDAFHPETLGRLVGGDPTFVPATPAAVLELLAHHDVPTEGADVALVGRSSVIGRPLANRLLAKADPGNATVTVCHSATRDLAEQTRGADIVVTAAGRPGLVDGSMLSPGATVIDVSATRTTADGEVRYAGDVDFDSALAVADAVTPVPGGVGPVTVAMLMQNTVLAAERQSDRADGGRSP